MPKVKYRASCKVQNPANRFENSDFSVELETSFGFGDWPEDPEEEVVYVQALSARFAEVTDFLRQQVETELQKDIEQFQKDNSPE